MARQQDPEHRSKEHVERDTLRSRKYWSSDLVTLVQEKDLFTALDVLCKLRASADTEDIPDAFQMSTARVTSTCTRRIGSCIPGARLDVMTKGSKSQWAFSPGFKRGGVFKTLKSQISEFLLVKSFDCSKTAGAMPPSGSSICLPAELRCVKGRVLEVRVRLRPRAATSMVVASHVSSHVECRKQHV